MDLSEERYYQPIYEWHAKRGLIYGCDNLGRGRNPLSYVDYFRAISWFTAPGMMLHLWVPAFWRRSFEFYSAFI